MVVSFTHWYIDENLVNFCCWDEFYQWNHKILLRNTQQM